LRAGTYAEVPALSFDLATRVQRPSRRPIALANIATTGAQAGDLYAALYAPALAVWTAGQARILAEYEATVAQMRTDTAETTAGAIDSIDAEINRLVITLTPDLRRWALRVERVHRGKWVRSVLSATDVDLNTILTADDVEDTLGASINWNAALVRDVSDDARRRIANAVFAGFQRRAPARDIAKEITEATGLVRARARRIAADQTVKLGARLNQARQEQAGLTSFKYRHSGKAHPRSWHKERDGRIFPWKGPGSIAPDDQPGVPPFCGCTAQGIVTFDSE
jgi:SPP1 gp7 family putative phage head morphogenesis protein